MRSATPNKIKRREVGYSPQAEEAQSGAPTGKRSHKERLTMMETRLDVLEASLEELYQGQGRILGVESSQEEAESRIDRVESLVDRLTEDTKDSVRHLHEVVAELTAKVTGLQVHTRSQTAGVAHEERGSEQNKHREVGYSPRAEKAQSDASTGKRSHKERLTMMETRLDVLEASLEELYQGQGRILGVESSQEAESWIDRVMSLVDRLTEDTKDSVRHLHEVVAELTAKVTITKKKRKSMEEVETSKMRQVVGQLNDR
ncbi:hypothetical protein B296_00028412 [Ensete ventricosum]|uniref:Uncharacterized protein n=1 Tax=Ensete ventricosum TaxID=4639 RepID=A0A426X9H4_ENSVE|nr:hypothetical protein B296_00028412 [Ensete ventricosum]